MKSVNRRGLSLLETLLASAILAMLATVCVPIFSQALAALKQPEASNDELRFDLARLADAFVADSEKFGIKDLSKAAQQGDLVMHWPQGMSQETRPGVSVHAMSTATDKPDHLWLAFRCEDQIVIRFFALPKSAEEDAE